MYENWMPTNDGINSLPEKIREYVHGLETLADPAGIVAENTLVKDENEQLRAEVERLKPIETMLKKILEYYSDAHYPLSGLAYLAYKDISVKDMIEKVLNGKD